MLKSNRDPTQRYKVIIEKPTYAGDEMHSSLNQFAFLSSIYILRFITIGEIKVPNIGGLYIE